MSNSDTIVYFRSAAFGLVLVAGIFIKGKATYILDVALWASLYFWHIW